MKVAQVLYKELEIGAVAITDREKLLAFTGIGDDHHLPGRPISSVWTQRAIETGEVVYADGNEVPYRCSLHPHCKLGSTLVIPLRGENQRVVGTIKLYEAKNRLFSSINRTYGGKGLPSCCRRRSRPGSMNVRKRCLPSQKSNCCTRRLTRISCLTR